MILDLTTVSTLDGCDLVLESNDLGLNDDLGTMILLSIFGGDDDFFANDLITDESKRLQSKTLDILLNHSINSQFRVLLQNAILEDLAYLKQYLQVNKLTVEVILLSDNVVKIFIQLDAQSYQFEIEKGIEINNILIRRF